MKHFFIAFIALTIVIDASAQNELSAETNLIDQEKFYKWKYNKEDLGTITSLDDGVKEVTTLVHIDKRYGLSSKLPINAINIRKGEKILLTFTAKTIESSLETGEAKVLWQFNVSEDRKDRSHHVLSIGNEWKTYYIPIEVTSYIKKKDLDVVMQFGFPPQKFLIKDIGFYHFDKSVPFDSLPKTVITYAGIEADAQWRFDAQQRIDSLRKGNFEIRVTQNGDPIQNMGLNIKMIKHHFDWGVALHADEIKDKDFFRKKVAESFNLVVLKNDLKIKKFDRIGSTKSLLKTMDQLRKSGLKIKGHVLIWPGYRYLTPEFRKHNDDAAKTNQMMAQHLENILTKTDGYIDRWDVVNEAYTNRDLQKVTGSEEILYNGFRKLKKEYPNIKRFVNEYGIISRGGLNTIKQEWYFDYINRIDKNTGDAVDGIGIQSHIGTDLTSPEKIFSILDYYAQLNKHISISEFTMDIHDPLLRQLYTEDFLTIVFSHPSVSEFLFWGFKGDNFDKVDIYNSDWTLGSMGKAYFNLVHGVWKTDIATTTNEKGIAKDRGFYGTYEYTYLINGETRKGKFKHIPGQKTVINIAL